MSAFTIALAGALTVTDRGDGLYDVNAGEWRLERQGGTLDVEQPDGTTDTVERTTAIEFAGEPWLEGLTRDELDALRIGGYTLAQLQEHAS